MRSTFLLFSEYYFLDVAGHTCHRHSNLWRNTLKLSTKHFSNYVFNVSIDKPVIDDSEKVLNLPINIPEVPKPKKEKKETLVNVS
jgi:hypothetical protein